jgi:hypothetical protein
MASYNPMRSSSDGEDRHIESKDTMDNEEDRETDTESSGEADVVDQSEGLLPKEARDVEKAGRSGRPVVRGNRSFVTRFVTAGIVAAIVLFDLWLVLQPNSIMTPSPPPGPGLVDMVKVPLRRPDEDYVLDSNWDFAAPNQVRYYNWTIVDKEGNPDGVYKPMMTINGQFPGPLIEANDGDTIVVDVLNLAVNATAIHWHGIFQNGSAWMDGTAGVTQCPIAPGKSFQYKFAVNDQAGTCKLSRNDTICSICMRPPFSDSRFQISTTDTRGSNPSTAS